MPEYLSPGVYVEEVDTGNKPIEGVATSTVGFVGITERGPVEPRLVTSFPEFVRTFGGYVDNRYLAHGVEGFFQNGGKRGFVMRAVSDDPAAAASTDTIDARMQVDAVGPGTWGDQIAVKVDDAGNGDANLFKLYVMYWETMPPLPLVDPTDPANNTNANRREPTVLDVYDNLSSDPISSAFYERQVNGFSNLVELTQTAPGRPANTPDPPGFLGAGNDGAAIDAADYIGDPTAQPGQKRGLAALEEVDEIAILCCPDENDFAGVGAAMVQQAEQLMDRFVILQAAQNPPLIANHFPSINSRYAAYYYPWVEIRHPRTGVEMLIPPGGHVAGIYNRSDTRVGVHKAPANEPIRGITDLQVQVVRGQQDLLNPRGVNVLRQFPGRGPLVWGARTTSQDTDWRYVNVRRLFIFLEESIDEGTQWAVFEPNDEPTWARVRRAVSDFLRRLWMDGMLQGATPEEAYFVRCDRTTMSQADIDLGRLIVLVGVAPVKPAEFVIFRIGQWTGGSQITEG